MKKILISVIILSAILLAAMAVYAGKINWRFRTPAATEKPIPVPCGNTVLPSVILF